MVARFSPEYHHFCVPEMEKHFVDVPGFEGRYEISIEEPRTVRTKVTKVVLDPWYNGLGDEAYLLDSELYLVDELIPN